MDVQDYYSKELKKLTHPGGRLLLFHGSPEHITEIRPNSYLTDSESVAESYGAERAIDRGKTSYFVYQVFIDNEHAQTKGQHYNVDQGHDYWITKVPLEVASVKKHTIHH